MNRNVPRKELVEGVKGYLKSISKDSFLKALDHEMYKDAEISAKSVTWAHHDLPLRLDNELPEISSVMGLREEKRKFKWTLNCRWENPGIESMHKQVDTHQTEDNPLSEAA